MSGAPAPPSPPDHVPPDGLPLSIYVHLPWCAKKCPYCDFNSHAIQSAAIPETDYVDALLRDLDHELATNPEPRSLGSIFFGGGTPSLFSGAAIGRVLEGIARRLHLEADAEITLEANPGTADAANFRDYRAAGVNRMSIGVQSFDEGQLRALGRIHGRDEALRAFALARDAGFDNLNLDLMFALPGQTVDGALADVDAALALAPEHLSWYHLTLEPNTEFASRPPAHLPDADGAADIHDAGLARLEGAGYRQYETSAFAAPGRQCRHNLNYWRFGDYLGIGAGAHAKRSANHGRTLSIERRARHKHPRTYMASAGNASAVQETRSVSASERPFEYAMNLLRLHEGFTRADYEARTGLGFESLDRPLSEARRLGLIEAQADHVQPTARGRRFQNRMFELFL